MRPESGMPTEYDYDCVVCCRPMIILLKSLEDIYAISVSLITVGASVGSAIRWLVGGRR
jgi:hypothetical protein